MMERCVGNISTFNFNIIPYQPHWWLNVLQAYNLIRKPFRRLHSEKCEVRMLSMAYHIDGLQIRRLQHVKLAFFSSTVLREEVHDTNTFFYEKTCTISAVDSRGRFLCNSYEKLEQRMCKPSMPSSGLSRVDPDLRSIQPGRQVFTRYLSLPRSRPCCQNHKFGHLSSLTSR